MKVKLINESTGFGFNSVVAEWLAQNIENGLLINKIPTGEIIDIPDKIALNCHNLVNVETGEIASKFYSLTINLEDLKKYKIQHEELKPLEKLITLKRINKNKIGEK
jgi:hypothetical protein